MLNQQLELNDLKYLESNFQFVYSKYKYRKDQIQLLPLFEKMDLIKQQSIY